MASHSLHSGLSLVPTFNNPVGATSSLADYLFCWWLDGFFFLVFFNLCIGAYLYHLLIRRRTAKSLFSRSICPELYLGLLLLFFMVYPYFLKTHPAEGMNGRTLSVGICQPYLLDKWVEGRAVSHKERLCKQTKFLSLLQPDIILWPEASTPYPINRSFMGRGIG